MLRTVNPLLQIPSHSGKLALFVLNLFLSVHPVSAQQSDDFSRSEVTAAQRSMIQKLSGATTIRNDIYLSSRSTASERKEVASFLFRSLEAHGLKAEEHRYKVSNKLFLLDLFFNPFMGTNVYTVIPSTTGSNEYVLLGAHYDSEPGSPGANDNATGVSLAFQVALQLQKLEHRERNFIIVFFDQEEDELIGSGAFARKMKKDGLLLHSVHTVDMVGWDADKDGAVELEYPSADLKALYAGAAEQLDIPLYETKVLSSDHASFRKLGYEATGIAEEYANGDTTPHYHKPTDTAETVDYDYLVNTTHLVWLAMKQLATPQNNAL